MIRRRQQNRASDSVGAPIDLLGDFYQEKPRRSGAKEWSAMAGWYRSAAKTTSKSRPGSGVLSFVRDGVPSETSLGVVIHTAMRQAT
jgi:hypothetical protein